ncbi:hypothetical protein FQR65_LT01308 [Abscondita terminalis]|nr:hypothetical protein FQR65_LT01308 [Abscondita terminalis]
MPGKVPNKNTGVQDSLLYYDSQRPKRRNCCCICCLSTFIIILILSILGFLLIFVGFPMLYKHSKELQISTVFPTEDLLPIHPEYGNFAKYNLSGVRNFYLTVDEERHVVLGVWHLLPEAVVNTLSNDSNECSYKQSLEELHFPVLIHFHESGGNRIKYIDMYKILRQHFHVVAFDYRGYGDSSPVQPSESRIVEDSMKLYKWVQSETEAPIYLWGHGLGAAISSHTVARLHDENIVPSGLFLEAPFTTIKDQLKAKSPFKFFSWLPWYETTMLDSLADHGFILNTTEYLISVNCCVMIVHAKDDRNTPFTFSEELYKVGQNHNKSITLHLLPEQLRCGHYSIRKAPQLLEYINITSRTHLIFLAKKNSKDDVEVATKVEPYIRYKGTEYRKTLRLKIPPCQPIKSRLKRFLNWITFVWCHSRARKCRKLTFNLVLAINTHESYNAPIQYRQDYSMQTFIKPKNMLVIVNNVFNTSVGLWSLNGHIKRSNSGSWNTRNNKFTLEKQEVPYLLYFHDFSGDRRTYVDVYSVLLRKFHVMAFDYRGFGDSSPGGLTETEMVKDSVNLYKWLRSHTNSSIYLWGDRRGAAVAALTVRRLQNENIEPSGLILENPSLSASLYLKRNWFIAKMVSYTLWYRQTITQPLIESDLYFSINDAILDIKCPIVFCVYGEYRNKFDKYVNQYSFDYMISQEHKRFKPNIGYYISYNYDVDFFDDWISLLRGNEKEMSCCFIQCNLVFPDQHLEGDIDPLINHTNSDRRYQCTISTSKVYKKLCNLILYIYDLCRSKSARKCRRRLLLQIALAVLIVFAILVVFPLVIMNFPELLRNSIFRPNRAIPSVFRSDFPLGRSDADCSEKPESFRVLVNVNERITLGVWHIQPYMRHDCAESLDIPYMPFNESTHPVIVYFHNGFGDRRNFLDTYFELRQFFHVITFDYRDVYVWGDALGAAIATRTLSLLPDANLTGLILENPFTSVSDLFKSWFWPLGRILSWMPWYNRAVTRTLEDNYLSFNTSKYIRTINSSVMILSWPNSEIPYAMGKELGFLASDRDLLRQGSVTYNQVPWYYYERDRYSNVIPQFIRDFIVECNNFKNRNTSLTERLLD